MSELEKQPMQTWSHAQLLDHIKKLEQKLESAIKVMKYQQDALRDHVHMAYSKRGAMALGEAAKFLAMIKENEGE